MPNPDARNLVAHPFAPSAGAGLRAEASTYQINPHGTMSGAGDLLPSGTRTTAAIVFIDLARFTALSEDVGLDATHRILTQFHSIVGSTAAASYGRVAAHLGDGAMLVFADGRNPAENAVRAIVACGCLVRRITAWMSGGNEARLPDGYRIGAHLGEVVMAELSHRSDGGATPLGDVVNVAHRLLEIAKHRRAQIALSEELVRAAGTLAPELAQILQRREQVAIRGRRKGMSVHLVYAPPLLGAVETYGPAAGSRARQISALPDGVAGLDPTDSPHNGQNGRRYHMSSSIRIRTVETSYGSLAVEEGGSGGTPLLLIHGNSSCRGVFRRQLQSPLCIGRRIVAFDLPGHGQSSDALDPLRTYTLPGLADAAIELLATLGISEVVVLGWSLGGHIGIEMMHRFPGMKGLFITGAPPVRREGMEEGFVMSPQFRLASRSELSDADVDAFARAVFGRPVEPFLRAAIARADGRFRQRLFEAARAGDGIDQRSAVENSSVPLAVVNGADDRLINLDYVDTVAYGNLWDRRCHRLTGVGHAPFWHAASEFNALAERFLKDVG